MPVLVLAMPPKAFQSTQRQGLVREREPSQWPGTLNCLHCLQMPNGNTVNKAQRIRLKSPQEIMLKETTVLKDKLFIIAVSTEPERSSWG